MASFFDSEEHNRSWIWFQPFDLEKSGQIISPKSAEKLDLAASVMSQICKVTSKTGIQCICYTSSQHVRYYVNPSPGCWIYAEYLTCIKYSI